MPTETTAYKNTGNFRFWARRFLGESYRADYDYQALLDAVMTKLNTQINQTTALTTAVNNLKQVYTTISGYNSNYPTAETYINEVNNELDIWALDMLPQLEQTSTKYIINTEVINQ